jgi:uncharacterized protein (TIGR02453 family)
MPSTVDAEPFTGFSPAAIQFLVDLAANNERAWFQPRKGEYERLLKQPLEALCIALADRFERRRIPLQADPHRSPFRIYRDTRFSRDKSPYKTAVAASFPWVDESGGTVDSGAHANGGYFSFRPGEMFFGGGTWHPERPRLEAFRRAVVDDPDRVAAALEAPQFVEWFGSAHGEDELKRVPPGYPADHPRADWLRWKDIIFGRRLTDAEVCSPELPDLLSDGFEAALPVFRFLASLR